MSTKLGGEFCLVCGAEPPLYGDRMCEPCIRKRVKLVEVPENIPWIRCARCGIVEIQGKWVQIEEKEIWDELIQRHVQFHKDAENVG
ncbi:MAG TPA: hypothetical protein HA356_01590, partial [Candidatus Poseidoniaceae archaeon]